MRVARADGAGAQRSACVHFGNRQLPLADLHERGARAAQSLRNAGIGSGDVIAILLYNEPAFLEAITCLRCLDAVLVLVPWHLRTAELQQVFAVTGPRLIIMHTHFAVPVRAACAGLAGVRFAVVETPAETLQAFGLGTDMPIPAGAGFWRWQDLVGQGRARLPVPPRTLQAIAVSSGSTGQPKIIRREGKPHWRQWATQCLQAWPKIRSSIVTAPLYHTGQYGVFSQACHLGADQVILPRFTPEAFLQAVERHRANHAYLGPPMFVQLLRLPAPVRQQHDVSSLDCLVQTGAPCAPAIKRKMIAWLGPVIWEVYGASECSLISASSSREWLERPGTVGRPLRRVVILDATGSPCPAGQVGEIYLDLTDLPGLRYQNARVRRRAVGPTDLVSVGDRGWLDTAGYLYLAGRIDEVINNGRLKTYPEEIEQAILAHPAVEDCVVFPIADPVWGQAIAAAVTAAAGQEIQAADLRAWLAGRMSEHKIPVRIWCQSQPLRPATGKVNRQALAARLLAGACPGQPAT